MLSGLDDARVACLIADTLGREACFLFVRGFKELHQHLARALDGGRGERELSPGLGEHGLAFVDAGLQQRAQAV